MSPSDGQTDRGRHGIPYLSGLPDRIRTDDLQSRSLTRYPAEPRVVIQLPKYCTTNLLNCKPKNDFFQKKNKFFQKSLKQVLTNRFFSAIIQSVENIGASPSGKATDSDSVITGVRIPVPQPKNPTRKSWIFSFVPTGTTSFAWHTQHHLTVRSTSLPLAAQMNEVEALPQMMLQQVAKDVMLRINEVGLRLMMLRFARTDTPSP